MATQSTLGSQTQLFRPNESNRRANLHRDFLMKDRVAISLVVCTRNRATRLAQALPYFAALNCNLASELIFVNNASVDGTSELLTDFAGCSPIEVQVIEEPNGGVSKGRNAGWRAARGQIVAFTDDDCYPAPDYLEQLRLCFAEPELDFLGGRILLFDPADYPITIQPLARRVDIPPCSYLPTGMMHGASIAFRREALERAEGFDERFGPGAELKCAEDVDLLARVSALGFRGAYDHRPLVFHHHRRSGREEVRLLEELYDFGRGAYFAKALADRRRRGVYVWPALRRVGGNLMRLDFGVMKREFHGAWRYIAA
jgi:glycosyltransferase involved in cell wall biosynthesis